MVALMFLGLSLMMLGVAGFIWLFWIGAKHPTKEDNQLHESLSKLNKSLGTLVETMDKATGEEKGSDV